MCDHNGVHFKDQKQVDEDHENDIRHIKKIIALQKVLR